MGQLEANPKGRMNVITLRSGMQLDKPRITQGEKGDGLVKDKGKPLMEDEVDLVLKDKGQDKHEEVTKPMMVYSYRLRVPLPQRLAKAKLGDKFRKFVEVLKKLKISIPFLDAISEMPSYAKFLNEILSNKGNFKNMPWFTSRSSVAQFFKTNSLPSLKIQ